MGQSSSALRSGSGHDESRSGHMVNNDDPTSHYSHSLRRRRTSSSSPSSISYERRIKRSNRSERNEQLQPAASAQSQQNMSVNMVHSQQGGSSADPSVGPYIDSSISAHSPEALSTTSSAPFTYCPSSASGSTNAGNTSARGIFQGRTRRSLRRLRDHALSSLSNRSRGNNNHPSEARPASLTPSTSTSSASDESVENVRISLSAIQPAQESPADSPGEDPATSSSGTEYHDVTDDHEYDIETNVERSARQSAYQPLSSSTTAENEPLVRTSSQRSSLHLNPQNSPYGLSSTMAMSPHTSSQSVASSSLFEHENGNASSVSQQSRENNGDAFPSAPASGVPMLDSRALLARILSLASTIGVPGGSQDSSSSHSLGDGPQTSRNDEAASDDSEDEDYEDEDEDSEQSSESESDDPEEERPAYTRNLPRHLTTPSVTSNIAASTTLASDGLSPVSLISRAMDAVLNGLSATEDRNHFAFSRQLLSLNPPRNNSREQGSNEENNGETENGPHLFVIGIRSLAAERNNNPDHDTSSAGPTRSGLSLNSAVMRSEAAFRASLVGTDEHETDDITDIHDQHDRTASYDNGHTRETETDLFEHFISEDEDEELDDDSDSDEGIDEQLREIFGRPSGSQSTDRPSLNPAPRGPRSRLRTMFASFRRSARRNGIFGHSDEEEPVPASTEDEPQEGRRVSQETNQPAQVWTLYFFTSYSGNDPSNLSNSFASLLSAPSLFTDSPNYEDLLLLEQIMGQVRPPTASRGEVDAAGGIEFVGSMRSAKTRVTVKDACSVCLSRYELDEECRRLNTCGHVFHRGCIDQWLVTGRNTCPLCRTEGVKTGNAQGADGVGNDPVPL